MSSWPRLLLLLLLLLCCATTPVPACDWLNEYGHLSNVSLHHLRQMGSEPSPHRCPVAFPSNLYRHYRRAQVESQLTFVRDSFNFLFDLWLHLLDHNNLRAVGWKPEKIQHFLSAIRRQKTEFDSCLTGKQPTDRRLRSYYRRLQRKLLGQTGGSSASWESIRWVTKVHLEQLDIVLSHIKRKRHA